VLPPHHRLLSHHSRRLPSTPPVVLSFYALALTHHAQCLPWSPQPAQLEHGCLRLLHHAQTTAPTYADSTMTWSAFKWLLWSQLMLLKLRRSRVCFGVLPWDCALDMTRAADDVYAKGERLIIGVSFSAPSEPFANAPGPSPMRVLSFHPTSNCARLMPGINCGSPGESLEGTSTHAKPAAALLISPQAVLNPCEIGIGRLVFGAAWVLGV
jgi:hypothetical protein